MYSILIRTGKSSDKYSYYLNSDGSVYVADNVETVAEKVSELLETYPVSMITVVRNCIITNSITIEEVE